MKLKIYIELIKPRITMLALCMAALGFYFGSPGQVDYVRLSILMFGLLLVGGCCNALNQYLERDVDSCMWRTMKRPLPSGRIEPGEVLKFGLILGVLGELVLLVGTNSVTAVLAAFTILFYVGIYTPSKRVSSLSTLIGAIPGAMPPLMGFTAAYGKLGAMGAVLFAILFIWQIPHFLSIAWIYREDYGRAGLPILSVIDQRGSKLAREVILYAAVLIPITLLPSVWGITSDGYLWAALLLGLFFMASSFWMAISRSIGVARALFAISILYLPVLGIFMIWNRV